MMMINNIKLYFYAFVVLSFLSCLYISYQKGYAKASAEYETEMQKIRLDNKQALLNQERLYQDKANLIIRDYQNKLEVQNAEFENEISKMQASNLRDVISTPCLHNESDNNTKRVSKEDNTSNLRCYTEEQLLEKIKRSLVIARECDQLAERYNALLEVCKQ